MGEILEYRPKAPEGVRSVKPTAPAEIFIFPGVRIERKGFSLADRLNSPGKSVLSGQKSKE